MNIQEIVGGSQRVSIVNDPFKKNCVESIWTHAMKIGDGWIFKGRVFFKNGNTKGEQEFYGNNIANVLQQIEAFCTGLE